MVEKLLGQLREVVGEKKEQDRRGRQFEEQTRVRPSGHMTEAEGHGRCGGSRGLLLEPLADCCGLWVVGVQEEAACMSLHQHRHRHRGLFVSLDLTAEDDGTADITAQAATAEHHEEEQPMEELQQAVLDRATSLTRVVSGGKSMCVTTIALLQLLHGR